ncbi:MAG: permease prefix domain 1-containing protein [Eubacteriales bacterium]|nr:permease prefix domain 1-containing protein [Eubacteriales bacterium]
MYWPCYRVRVRRELTDHILCHATQLRATQGLDEQEAVQQALRALGDPDALGLSLRQARCSLRALLPRLLTGVIWAAIAACAVYLILILIPR